MTQTSEEKHNADIYETHERLARLESGMENLIAAINLERKETQRVWEELSGLSRRLGDMGKPDWKAVFAGFAIILTVIMPIMTGITGFAIYSYSSMSTMSESIRTVQQNIQNLNANDLALEQRFGARSGDNADAIGVIEAEVGRLRTAMTERVGEIETQFHGLNTVMNVRDAEQMRFNSIMYEKVFDARYPDIEYFPSIKVPNLDGIRE